MGPLRSFSSAEENDIVPVLPRPLPITSTLRERSVGLGAFPLLNESNVDAILRTVRCPLKGAQEFRMKV